MSEPLRPFVVAMVFGSPANTIPVIVVNLAPNEVSAAVMAVSRAHLDGQTQAIVGFNVAELTDEFITAAHRGTADPAPVFSLVQPQIDAGMAAPPLVATPMATNDGVILSPSPLPDGAA